MHAAFDKRLLFVTGKGGVGKSTVAGALALAAARRGRRTIVCELAGQQRMARLFGRKQLGADETELAPGLAAISIDPQRALERYLRLRVGSRTLSGLLFENRVFQHLVAATPGAKELVSIGTVWELAQAERPTGAPERYDLVVVDAPATGHGLGMLSVARTFREVARVGPIRRQADRIDVFLRDDRRTGVVAVAAAEELAVAETLELRAGLREELGVEPAAIVVNGLLPERFDDEAARTIGAAVEADGLPASTRAAARLALDGHERARAQREQLERLRSELGDVVELPFAFDPELDLDAVRSLSRRLEGGFGTDGDGAGGAGR